MAEKAILCDQQTTKNGHLVTTTLNGQKKKMKNLTVYKTVLAPKAPWPKIEELPILKPKRPWKDVLISCENDTLDQFLQDNEKLNQHKIATKSRIRDKLSGRFKSN